MIEGEKSAEMSSYSLPVIDVCRRLRNFEGYRENQYFNLGDLQMGDTSGTTETDSATAPKSGGYTRINS